MFVILQIIYTFAVLFPKRYDSGLHDKDNQLI